MPITEEQVLSALGQVKFPGLSRDIVSFGFIKDLKVEADSVSLVLELTTENAKAGETIKADVEEVLAGLEGVRESSVKLRVQLPQMQRPAGPPKPQILQDVRFKVAIASGKGGVGKSTVAANLALALTKLGHRVGLMDSDIYGPSQQMMMGVDEQPMVDQDEKIIPIERYGVQVMSIGMIVDVDQPVVWRGPMVMRAVEQFLQDVRWGKLDFLLIDLPPGTGDAQLTLTQKIALDGAVIVTTPQDVALIDARKGLAMFEKVSVPLLGIIENMSYYECTECGHREHIFKQGGGQRTAALLKVPFLGSVPLDPAVVVGGDTGRPIVASDPESVVAKAFFDTARSVARSVGA